MWRILGSVGLKRDEGPRTARLFAFILLLTLSVVLSRSAQRDLFLAAYPRSSIPDAFLWSALALCVTSLGISALASRLGLLRLVYALVASSVGALVLSWLSVRLFPALSPMGVYVTVEVLTGVVVTQGWAVATEVVDVRAAKRLLPIIGLGAGLAWTAGGFMVSALTRWLSSANLLLLAGALLSCSLGMLALVARRDLSLVARPEVRSERFWSGLTSGLRYIVSEPLMRVMAAVITIELVVERIVDFQLLSVAQERYAAVPGGVASFMGLFFGITGAVTLVAPLLASGRVLTQIGSTRTLLLGQAWVLLASALFLAVPTLAVVVLLAGGDRILKQALGAPARSQIFGAVSPVRRAQAGALLRGVVAALFSALAALALKLVPASWPAQVLAVGSVALMGGLMWLTQQGLRKGYLLALQRSVDNRRLDLDEGGGGQLGRDLDQEQVTTLIAEVRSNDPERADFALSVLSGVRAERARPLLREALAHPNESVRAHAATQLSRAGTPADLQALAQALEGAQGDELRCACLQALTALGSADTRELLSRYVDAPSPKVRALARAGLSWLGQGLDAQQAAVEAFAAMLSSPSEAERGAAAWALDQVPVEATRFREGLLPLVRDASVAVRQAAVRAAGQFDDPELVRSVVFALQEPATSTAAFDAFPKLRSGAVETVKGVLEKAPNELVASTTSALARAQGAGATDLLQDLLTHADPHVRHRAARALALRRRSGGWTAPSGPLLERAIHAELERGYAYYATLSGLEAVLREGPVDSGARQFLLGELELRIQETERRLLALVALVADPRIARLSHQLRDASTQVTARLLELIEQSLDSQLAKLVVPFFERTPLEARARQAAETFQLPAVFREDPLAGIIEFDDPHLRRCALLVFQEQLSRRYPGLQDREAPLLPLVERIRLLRHVPLFKGLTPEDLMKLAEIAESMHYSAGQVIFRKGDLGDVLCVVLQGKVEIREHDRLIATQGPNDFFGELALFDQEPRSADAVAVVDTELLNIGGADLDALMERRPEIAREILRVLAKRLRRTTEAMLRSTSSPSLPAVGTTTPPAPGR